MTINPHDDASEETEARDARLGPRLFRESPGWSDPDAPLIAAVRRVSEEEPDDGDG